MSDRRRKKTRSHCDSSTTDVVETKTIGEELLSIADSFSNELSTRHASLLWLLKKTPVVDSALRNGIIELRASSDDTRSILPSALVVRVNAGDSQQALSSVAKIEAGRDAIMLHNCLQFLTEVRQFLKSVFGKLSDNGFLVIVVPHQFLLERKYRLPSRQNGLHRRFYTSSTLLSDLEEAVDPAQFRIRSLVENDFLYDYTAPPDRKPEGGQDIVLVVQRLPKPNWGDIVADDERWSDRFKSPWSTRVIELADHEKAQARIKVFHPDRNAIANILVVKLDHRGDFLLASEAFEALRRAFPSAAITLMCGSWNRAEAQSSGFFDRVIAFDFFPEDDSARLASPGRDVLLQKFAVMMTDEAFDLAVDLRLYDDTRELLRAAPARHTAGFDRSGAFPWLSISLDTLSGTDDDRAEQGFMRADAFYNGLGRHRDFEIRLDEAQRHEETKTFIWGPYRKFKQGRYEFECLIEPLGDSCDVMFDVAGEKGALVLAAGVFSLERTKPNTVWFSIPRAIADLEFRLWAAKGAELKPLRFSGVRYTRYADGRGVHQTEAMVLLAELIKLRLREPFTAAVL